MRSQKDGRVVIEDIYAELREHIRKKYGTSANAAAVLGINPSSLSLMLKGERTISEVLLADAGIEAITPPVQYVRIERRRNRK